MTTLEERDDRKIMYMHCNMPMITDRDLVCEIIKTNVSKDEVLFTVNTVQHEKAPVKPKCIRIEMFRGVRIQKVSGKNDIKITAIGYSDLKGCNF